MLISKFQLGVALAAVAGLSASLVWSGRENAHLRREIIRQAAAAPGTAELRRQVAAETQRVAVAEAKVAALLKTADSMLQAARATQPAAGELTNTQDVLKVTLAHAKQLIQEGKFQAALEEYLKCYREVEPKRPGSSECQSLMSALGALGRRYPPAMVALGELRDAAMTRHQEHPENRDLVFEIALLNLRLDEGNRTVILYDSLSPNDNQRQSLAMIGFDGFVEARRYSDALLGKSFGSMLSWVDAGAEQMAKQSGSHQAEVRKSVVDASVVNIEVLTGAGKLDDARVLTEKLLQFDSSESTRATLKQHVERAQEKVEESHVPE